MTSKKRKRHLAYGGPFKPQAPEEVPVLPLAHSTVILVIDLDGDTEGSPPTSRPRV